MRVNVGKFLVSYTTKCKGSGTLILLLFFHDQRHCVCEIANNNDALQRICFIKQELVAGCKPAWKEV